MATTGSRIWITWERQRRSLELAKRLGCELHLLETGAPYLLRALLLGLKTLRILSRRPGVVYVQNPSILLAALAALMRPALGYVLVVDRHSNFKLHTSRNPWPKWRLFHQLSRYSVPRADLTIVTNQRLAALIQAWGGRPFVLPDPLPELPQARRRDLGEPTVVCVSSFGTDEPIAEVLSAAGIVGEGLRVVITGNPAKLPEEVKRRAPANVRFSGFLAEEEFQELIASCDAIMALTTQPNTLLCAGYEAVALGQPMILSDQEDLVSYFAKGRVATRNDAESIAAAMATAVAEREALRAECRDLAVELERSWSLRFDELQDTVSGLREPAGSEHST